MSEDQKQPARHAIHNLELYRNREAPWPNGALSVLKAFVDEATPSTSPASDADERAEFEAWVKAHFGCAEFSFARAYEQGYYNTVHSNTFGGTKQAEYAPVSMLWDVWQGARAASTRTASDTRTAAVPADCRNGAKGPGMCNACYSGDYANCYIDTRTAAGEAECDAAMLAAPASQHGAATVAELEAENDQLREALADKVSAATLLKKFSMEGNALEMTFEGGACHFLADSLGKQFRDMKGDNYIEMGFACSDGLNLLVTMQRVNGKTPAQLKTEAERKLAECEARLAESEASRGAAQGRITQAETRMDTGSCGGAQVDVEAERKLFGIAFVAEFGERMEWAIEAAWNSTSGKMWLAARTQADAGKALTTTKPENT